ncbi:hypothetical protein ACT6QH_00020 [Xanthobacter sp. TB0139]|uniref:hypothetical protein n=1 Tax=Xanthobacter sp. TB0139 TaxID=3459178 RepID=UPI0040394CC3
MNINKFLELIETTLSTAEQAGDLHKCMSRPSQELKELYGPMTDKVTKSRAILKAQELYDLYYESHPNADFKRAVNSLRDELVKMPTEVSNSAASSFTALVHLKGNFGKTLDDVISKVKEPPGALSTLMLSVMDASITTGLAFVPVAGPFLAPLSMGLNGMISYGLNAAVQYPVAYATGDQTLLFNSGSAAQVAAQKDAIGANTDPSAKNRAQDRASAAATGGKATANIASSMTGLADKTSLVGELAAQKGLASMIAVAARRYVDKNNAEVLAMADTKGNAFKTIITGALTQNQVVTDQINILSRIDVELPSSLQNTDRRKDIYLNEKATLETFKNSANDMFVQFYDFLIAIMGQGIEGSFSAALNLVNMPKCFDNKQRIAIIMMGYFFSKDWDGARKGRLQQAQRTHDAGITKHDALVTKKIGLHSALVATPTNRGVVSSLETRLAIVQSKLEANDDRIRAAKDFLNRSAAEKSNFSTTFGGGALKTVNAKNAFALAREATSKKPLLDLGVEFNSIDAAHDMSKLPEITERSKMYFRALKNAITADVESAILKGNKQFMSDDDMIKMWNLYIGAHLVVNLALSDSKLKLQGKLKRATRAVTPTTDSTNIPDYYVKMIEKGGFIQRYSGNIFMQVSTKKKKELAATGKMRWSRHPSDRERAMLVAFCTIVAFSMDVGKITLGFQSWDETVQGLKDVCRRISETAYA